MHTPECSAMFAQSRHRTPRCPGSLHGKRADVAVLRILPVAILHVSISQNAHYPLRWLIRRPRPTQGSGTPDGDEPSPLG